MEPCLFRHGKRIALPEWWQQCTRLQWSHVFSDMVSALLRLSIDTRVELQWSHVFSDMVSSSVLNRRPQTRHRLQWSHVFSDMVRKFLVPAGPVNIELQWSHVFSDMVRYPGEQRIPNEWRLQWSHVFSDMVSPVVPKGIEFCIFASMEPCLFRHGKGTLKVARKCRSVRCFNGAMSFQTW